MISSMQHCSRIQSADLSVACHVVFLLLHLHKFRRISHENIFLCQYFVPANLIEFMTPGEVSNYCSYTYRSLIYNY
jgi:hypothetical protein